MLIKFFGSQWKTWWDRCMAARSKSSQFQNNKSCNAHVQKCFLFMVSIRSNSAKPVEKKTTLGWDMKNMIINLLQYLINLYICLSDSNFNFNVSPIQIICMYDRASFDVRFYIFLFVLENCFKKSSCVVHFYTYFNSHINFIVSDK